MASPKGVTGQRHVIVLQPIGDFTRAANEDILHFSFATAPPAVRKFIALLRAQTFSTFVYATSTTLISLSFLLASQGW